MIKIGRYISDKNKDVFLFESGTYANTATALGGVWPGLVQEHNIDENTNVIRTRFTGNDSKNFGRKDITMKDVEGTLNFHPQDWRLLGLALGSTVDSGSPSPFIHDLKERDSCEPNLFTSGANCPFPSFTMESSHQCNPTGLNHIKTAKGCTVNQYVINGDEGGLLTVDVTYIGKEVVYSSGVTTAVTASTAKPYKWSDVTANIPSGTTLNNLRSWTFTINNNLNAPHYNNGSQEIDAPIPENRDYEWSLTIDADTTWSKRFYEQYFKGGSTFNALLPIVASTGSRELFLTMSGCFVDDMDDPNGNEGVVQQTITIIPQKVTGLVNDLIEKYNAW